MSQHRSMSISFLRSTGLPPVRVRPGQKDPFPDWDPRRVNSMDHENTLTEIQNKPEINLAALMCGRFVDIDIDTEDPVLEACLDHFLPRTPYVWGRGSKPRSHRVYALNTDFQRDKFSSVLRFMKALHVGERSLSVEVRGGKTENGLFSVLPGSVHPSGDEYRWHGTLDFSASAPNIEDHLLIKQLRLALAASLVAPYWISGIRNEMSLALAGLLWRVRSTSLAAMEAEDEHDVEPDVFMLSHDDAHAVFSAVVKQSGDDPDDKRSRLLNFKNTWAKLDKDPSAKATGGKVLSELIGGLEGEFVVKSLYRLLSDNDGVEQLEKLAEQFVVWYGQGVLIDLGLVKSGMPVPWMNREQARNSLGSRKIQLGKSKVPVANLLFTAPIVQRVYGMTFDPSTTDILSNTDQGLMVNQFKGFAKVPHAEPVSRDQVEPFLEYIHNIIADGDPEATHWVLAWLADLFQNPANKPGTTLVLIGAQGAGKTFLGEKIVGQIIGMTHYAQSNSITDLTDRFNAMMDNKLFMLCNEAIHSYQKDAAARLKSLITDDVMKIEPKNINAYFKPNYLRFMFTSNEQQAAMIIDPSPHERRYTVLKVSPSMAGKKPHQMEYWTKLRNWTDENIEVIFRFLMDYEYDRETIRRPLDTEIKRDLQRVGVDPEVSWLINGVAAGFPISEAGHKHWWHAFNAEGISEKDKANDVILRDSWPNTVSMKALEDDYRNYVRKHGKVIYSGNIVTSIKRAMPPNTVELISQVTVEHIDTRTGQRTKSRERLYRFPTAEQVLAHLKQQYGPVVDNLVEEAKRHVAAEQSGEPYDQDEKAEY